MAKSIASRLAALEKMVARLLKPENLMAPGRKKKKAKKKKSAAKKAARPKAKKRTTKKRRKRAAPVFAPMPVML